MNPGQVLDGTLLETRNLPRIQAKLGIGGDFVATSYTSGAPSGGTAAPWKFGSVITAPVTADLTRYVEIEIGGVPVKLVVAS